MYKLDRVRQRGWGTKYLYIQSTTVNVPSLELGLPHPFSRKRVCPPPYQGVGGHTRLLLKGWGSPNSNDWRNAQHSAYSVGWGYGVVWASSQEWATGPRFGCKTQKGPSKYGKLLRCVFFSLAAKICAELAGNFRQQLATVKSRAKDMVWLTLCYFTASQQGGGGGERGSRAYAPYTVTLPGSGGESKEGGLRSLPLVLVHCPVLYKIQSTEFLQLYVFFCFFWKDSGL